MQVHFLTGHTLDAVLVTAVEALLSSEPVTLRHGGEFTGKPTTRIHANSEHVVKLRRIGLERKRAERYALERVYVESRLGIHHPRKRWFLVQEEQELLLGNVSPRMRPLSVLPEIDPPAMEASLVSALRLYIHAAKDWNIRLDEGLSNFGLTPDGRLYYLDDDVFPWRGDTPMVSQLAVLLRQPDLLDACAWQRVGAALKPMLSDWLGTAGVRQLARRLEEELLPGESQRERRDAFNLGLGVPVETLRPVVPSFSGRIALLADVHANLPALESVLADMQARGLEHAIVLGDIVGYGPHPRQCIELLRGKPWCVIKGNHDNAVAQESASGYLSADARYVVEWTRARLHEMDIDWLDNLPERITTDDWMAVHGSPMDPTCFNGYVYEMTYEANLAWMRERGVRLCLHGHSHMRGVYFDGKRGMGRDGADRVLLHLHEHALVCPGSVGQPRDGSRGARYAVMDTAKGEIEHVCVTYDVERTQSDMLAAGLPVRLADRLAFGR